MTAPDLESVEDWRGRTIRVGDVVLYPRMSGRSCEMQEGTVERIVDKGTRRQFDHEAKDYVEVPAFGFRIMPTRSSRFRRWRPPSRPVVIQIGENVTALG